MHVVLHCLLFDLLLEKDNDGYDGCGL